MSALRTNTAAAMLGVSSNTLRGWETKYGYPTPRRSEGGHRQFELAEIEALRQALSQTQDIPSAIALVRERGAGPSSPTRLSAALRAFDEDGADRLLEESLAVRSVERTVESVLLPSVQALADERQGEAETPEYCFAWRYATGWLAATQRVAPPSTRPEGVLILDASGMLDLDGLYVQALELSVRRVGLRVLTLAMELDSARIGNALRALSPTALVLAGAGAELPSIGRVVYAARQIMGAELLVLDYRHAVPQTRASTVASIGTQPSEALGQLQAALPPRALSQTRPSHREPAAAGSIS